ncbi:MAG: membrane protein insertase YidC [Deltaproteobacteria bacterium]|nr:membrane protein insertase YidC [Deltaproteobacteria bacterium]
MEKSSILRWVIIGVVVWVAFQYGPRLWGGGGAGSDGKASGVQPLGAESSCSALLPCAPPERGAEALCELVGKRFKAQFSTKSASLKHLWLEGESYKLDGQPIDLVTTSDLEWRRPLRFEWRTMGVNDQVKYDAFDWVLESKDASSCVFSWSDEKVALKQIVKTTERPFELEVRATLQNLGKDKLAHRLSVEAASWRTEKEVESKLGRQSPFVTDVECLHDGKLKKMTPGDFEPGDFSDAGFDRGWFWQPGSINFAAVSNFYFSQALVPTGQPASSCMMQIEERWDTVNYPDKSKDPNYGAIYRSRLAWDKKELEPQQSAEYSVLAYFGPKERDVLAAAGGGSHKLGELVDLGYFSPIARYLLLYLVWLHKMIGNWGIAIILMTLSVRTVLFPLTWKQIKSGLGMRRLKPEIDEINRKFKDDAQQKNLATMELWKKHKINPFGGCLPAIFQLPVWWALYTSLQTAVELYHTPFIWFRDLSAPDPYYILPIVLGGTMILQQKMMPQQMDPMQQKMMTFVMPAVFTVMMLFLPSGLAVYMLTNAVLGILQQLMIEKYWSGQDPVAATAGSGIVVKDKPSLPSRGRKDGTG